MVRLDCAMGRNIRLIQRTPKTTITITHHQSGTVVKQEKTAQIGQYELYYYDFRPLFSGTYLISWDQAPAERRWEVLDVPDLSLWDLYNNVETIQSETPSAKTG